MLVYEDVFTGDEVVSDSFKQTAPFNDQTFNEVAFEVASRRVAQVNEDFGIAANVDDDAEAGATAEAGDSTAITVIDVVDKFNLEEYTLSKPEFKTYIKGYMGHLVKYLESNSPDRVATFKGGIAKLMKKILDEWDNCVIYMPRNYADFAPENKALPIIGYYLGEEAAPRFVFLKDGLKEIKC